MRHGVQTGRSERAERHGFEDAENGPTQSLIWICRII
jgi:hypothetical protein